MAVSDFTTRFGSLAGIANNLPVVSATGLRKSIYEASDTEITAAIRAYAISLGGDGDVAVSRFNDYVEMTRGYSVVIRRATLRDVLLTATQQSDPRVAMILGAARDKNTNQHLFQGPNEDPSQTLDNVYSFMFGANRPAGGGNVSGFADTTGDGTNSYYYSDLFVNGIRQISAALTAAVLIGRLSQVQEQAEHAQYTEQQALKDLATITETYSASGPTSSGGSTDTEDDSETANVVFYFQPGVIEVVEGEKLVVGYYSLMNRAYKEFEYGTGAVNVGQIVSDLADLINSDYLIGESNDALYNLENTQSPFIATASQSGQAFRGKRLVTLSVYPRHVVDRVIAQALNVRIYIANKPWSGGATPTRQFADNSHPSDASFAIATNPADSTDPQLPANDPAYIPAGDAKPVVDSIPDTNLFNTFVTTPLPFWGVNPDALSQTNNNGVLITIKSDKLKAVSSTSSPSDRPPTVKYQERKPTALYLRRKPSINQYPVYSGGTTHTVRVRLSSRLDITLESSPTIIEAPVKDGTITGYITQADIALALIDAMTMLQQTVSDVTVTGIIFRNDDPSATYTSPSEAITAMELICWAPGNSQPFSILDVLQIPAGFEISSGAVTTQWEETREGVYVNPTNYVSFHSRWGPAPRSIKVDNAAYIAESGNVVRSNGAATPILKSLKPTFNFRQIKEEHDALQDYRFL